MKDFILQLYKDDNFTLYLTIALIVLVILFVLVLIFGKRDQKLEETKRLQKIELEKNADAFKEEKIEPVKLETEEPIKEEKIISVESEPIKEIIPEAKEDKSEAVTEESKENLSNDVNVTVFEPKVEEPEEKEIELEPKEEPTIKIEPTIDIEEEKAPINVEDVSSFDFDDINDSLEQGLNELENIKNEFNSIEVPTINEENNEISEEDSNNFQPSQVFSSVFVNKETEAEVKQVEEKVNDEQETIINVEPEIKIENPQEKPTPTLIIQDEDDFELPDLKVAEPEKTEKQDNPEKEENITENKEETTFSFDDLINETYKIK